MQTVTGTDLELARHFLEQGELVAIPTETVYGLAANALRPEAVAKIFAAKNRPQFNPLIIHLHSWEQAGQYAAPIPLVATKLARHFCPGPLTFLLPKKDTVPDIVTAGSDLVALRIPRHPLALSLLAELPFPLAAPSANQSGYISPTSAAHVAQSLQGKIPYILDGGESTVGLESTIIGFDEQDAIILYRAGGIGIEELESVSGQKVNAAPDSAHKPLTSGQLRSHYAPHTALYIGSIPELYKQFSNQSIATISFREQYALPETVKQFVLSEKGDLNEAATKLFGVMRTIDTLQADIILTELFPEEGLGRAINDRLHRAQVIFKGS